MHKHDAKPAADFQVLKIGSMELSPNTEVILQRLSSKSEPLHLPQLLLSLEGTHQGKRKQC